MSCDLSVGQDTSRERVLSENKKAPSASAQKEDSSFPSTTNKRSRWQKRMLMTFILDRLKED